MTTPFEEITFEMETFDSWAGYSSQSLNDKEFLNSMGISGHHIPDWLKSNTAKWFKSGDITFDELVSTFDYLERQNILE